MDNAIVQIGESGGLLTVLIPVIIQALKRFPLFVKIHEDGFPIWELLSIGLGIGGAFILGIPIPLITGLISGLAAGKGYDLMKGGKP